MDKSPPRVKLPLAAAFTDFLVVVIGKLLMVRFVAPVEIGPENSRLVDATYLESKLDQLRPDICDLFALDLDGPPLNGASRATSLPELASCSFDETWRQMRGELVNYYYHFPAAVSRFSPKNDSPALPKWTLRLLG